MFVSKSITFDGEDITGTARAEHSPSVYYSVEFEFIEKLKSGDAEAFDLLIKRYSGDVYALLFRLTENAEEASDLTQETFLSALKAVASFRGEAELKTWLFRIAINHSRNRFRWWKRGRRDRTVSLDTPVGDSDLVIGDTLAGNSENPEEMALRRERENALTNALLDLPAVYREAIVLRDIEGCSYEDISHALSVNIGTVKSRIARGRLELRRRLMDF